MRLLVLVVSLGLGVATLGSSFLSQAGSWQGTALSAEASIHGVTGGIGTAEAENFYAQSSSSTHWWTSIAAGSGTGPAAASGNVFMTSQPNTGHRGVRGEVSLLYRFLVTFPGSYVIDVRGSGPSTGDDSVWVELFEGGGTAVGASPMFSFTAGDSWSWRTSGPYALIPGEYVVRVSMREDGVRLDQLNLRLEALPTPTGEGLPASPAEPVPPPKYQIVGGVGVAEAEAYTAQVRDRRDPYAWVTSDSGSSGPFANASGGSFVQVEPDTGLSGDRGATPLLKYRFEVPAEGDGSYRCYLRGRGAGVGSDSVYVQVTNLINEVVWQTTVFLDNRAWGWTECAQGTLTEGGYYLAISVREDGSALDKIVLQDSALAPPAGNGLATPTATPISEPFTVRSTDGGLVTPGILLFHDPTTGAGLDWAFYQGKPRKYMATNDRERLRVITRDAVLYLRDGIRQLTNQTLIIENRTDFDSARGIILTTLNGAPPDIQRDPVVLAALSADGDKDRQVEAFYIRSTSESLLVVANQLEGIVTAIPSLLRRAGYDVLEMGTNWIYAPGVQTELVFDLSYSDFPALKVRRFNTHSGGAGLLSESYRRALPEGSTLELAPPDEPYESSEFRWRIARRMMTHSVRYNPGHALQRWHRAVIQHHCSSYTGTAAQRLDRAGPEPLGFLMEYAEIGHGPPPQPPPPLWINDDHCPDRERNVEICVGEPESLGRPCTAYLKLLSEEPRRAQPLLIDVSADPDIHPGQFFDPLSESDVTFAFAEGVLREYDAYISGLDPENRVTVAGIDKRDLVRVDVQSYSDRATPPNFNLLPRIRVDMAQSPPRGTGPFAEYTRGRLPGAFRAFNPDIFLGDYRADSMQATHPVNTIIATKRLLFPPVSRRLLG
jgi:hypothetical protein